MANELEHFGVKGMKWGVRKDRPEGVSARTNREAKKDATEFARAKMYYGEGAGVRRRLIKASVESKSRSPEYKKAFDFHTDRMDMDKAASTARRQRKAKTAKDRGSKHAKGIINLATGNAATTTALASGLFTLGLYAHRTGVDKIIAEKGKTAYSEAVRRVNVEKNARNLRKNFRAQDFLK